MLLGVAAEHDVGDSGMQRCLLAHGRHCDRRREFHRIAVDAGADAGEGERGEAGGGGDFDAAAVAGGEQFGLAVAAVLPYRTDAVDDMARGQAMAPGIDPAIAAEAAREHLWRWLLDLPPLLGDSPLKEEFTAALGCIASDQRASLATLLDDPRLARFAARLDDLDAVPDAMATLLPAMDAAASLRHWPRLDAGFCRQPNWRGGAAETGAYARRGGGPGHAFALRWLARLAELRDWAQGVAKVGAGGTASAVPVAPGIGRALVETARGLLMHEIVLDGDTVAEYFIVAPTEWNFHPQGPLAGWLGGAEGKDREALRARVALAVATLDPCVRWELDGL